MPNDMNLPAGRENYRSYARTWLATNLPSHMRTDSLDYRSPTLEESRQWETAMYKAGLAGTMAGVVLANMVPALSFVIMVMIPFIEQIDPRVESAARVFGANTPRLFVHVLVPLLLPGVLAALLLVLVRTIAMFELTFLTAGPSSQTLVVALYYAVFSPGVRAVQSIDAMAVIYMVTALIWLVIALRFVNPTQIVARKGGGAH